MTRDELVVLLKAHATVGGVPEEELLWLASHGVPRHYAVGAVLTHAGGEMPEGLFILFSGHIVIRVDRGEGPKKVMEWHGGDVTGVLPYSRMVSPPGDSVALEPVDSLLIPRALMRDMIRECHEMTGILVHKMVDRARQFVSSDVHDEKMAALGRLSAGLAHELNNPAAAIERSAALLEDRLADAERATLALGAARLSDEQLSAVERIRDACLASPLRGVLSPLQQAQREDELTDWVEDHGLPATLGGLLADTTVSTQALDRIAGVVEGTSLEAVLRWAASGCAVRALSSEIQDAATRISGIVAAVKGFTYMDQGRTSEVDLPLAVQNTAVVMRSKARSKKAEIAVKIPSDLPKVCGYGGELNQVFANLIDNALDAIPEGGRVEISAALEQDHVVVHVVDNGSGIPPAILSRIFDPFFTTKPVGRGTGIGLDMVRKLLKHNNAQIEVESRPGHTDFTLTLPVSGHADAKGVQ
ncbi:MAG: ATP-binding protein [Vicinamibacterales bacterium]